MLREFNTSADQRSGYHGQFQISILNLGGVSAPHPSSFHKGHAISGYDLNFWRTKSGLEVDFVLGRGEVAVEVKGASRIDSSDLRPIKAFLQEYRPARAFVVCTEQRSRVHEGIHIIPWREFLEMLWNSAVLS